MQAARASQARAYAEQAARASQARAYAEQAARGKTPRAYAVATKASETKMDRILNAFLAIILFSAVLGVMQIADAAILLIGGALFFPPMEMLETAF